LQKVRARFGDGKLPILLLENHLFCSFVNVLPGKKYLKKYEIGLQFTVYNVQDKGCLINL
jgi:hypothetical protein